MKKLLSLVLVLALSISLCACAKEEPVETNDPEVIEEQVEVKINEIELNILKDMLTNVLENLEVGTAGSSLKAVPFASDFMAWSMGTEIKDIEIKLAYDQVLLEAESKDEFKDQVSLLESTINALLSDDCDALLEDSGMADKDLPWKGIMTEMNDSLKYLFSINK